MILGRILLIAGSYLCACLAAGSTISLLFVGLILSHGSFDLISPPALKALAAAIAVSSGFGAVLGLLPALPAIVYSERRGVRSFWFYTYGGSMIGLLSYSLFLGAFTRPEPDEVFRGFTFPHVGVWLMVACAGFLAGLVYWLMAGRSAAVSPLRRRAAAV